MAVARQHEDPVTLAATASRRVLDDGGIDPSTIGLCVVGTETAVDHSKPVAAYLHRLLGLPQQCRVFETKHACFGGTAGLLAALDWIASGSARGRKALIVCTDIARYGLSTPGEPTQGAGAVAMVVSENPRLLALEVGVTGSYAQDVNDFWRPLYSKEAVVDGHYSVQCYLDALAGAYKAWQEAAAATGTARSWRAAATTCRTARWRKKAHRHVMQLEGASEAEADASYAAEVALVAAGCRRRSATSTRARLYLALASLLEAEAGELEGKRIGLFSYGSGCCAEFFAGRVVAGAGAFADSLKLAEPLEGAGASYTFAEYEQIRLRDDMADKRAVDLSHGGEAHELPEGSIAFVGVDADRRVYIA